MALSKFCIIIITVLLSLLLLLLNSNTIVYQIKRPMGVINE